MYEEAGLNVGNVDETAVHYGRTLLLRQSVKGRSD